MGLIKCPDCGKKFSDKIDACPKCGCPRNEIENVNDESVEVLSDNKKKIIDRFKNKKVIIIASTLLTVILGIVILHFVFSKQEDKGFTDSVKILEAKNDKLDEVINEAEKLINNPVEVLDESIYIELEAMVSSLKASKKDIPEYPGKEKVDDVIKEIEAVNYSEDISKTKDLLAVIWLENKRYELVNVPSEEYIIQCLGKEPNITEISAVTEDNDPNGSLNKAGGYISQVFFSCNVINQKEIEGETLIAKGTEAGGSIEVYANKEDANKRNEYLSSFDGGILASGSHCVIGTVIIRTSNELIASQQKIIEENIIKILTYVDGDNLELSCLGKVEEIVTESTTNIENNKPSEEEKEEETSAIVEVESEENKENDRYLMAVNSATEYYDRDTSAGPNDVLEWLTSFDEYSYEEAIYAIENAGLDWKRRAVEWSNEYKDGCYMYPSELLSELELKGFNEEDCKYAIQNCNTDWDKCAIEAIQYISDANTRNEYVSKLQEYGFTVTQAEYGVNNSNIDWFTEACEYVENYLGEKGAVFSYCHIHGSCTGSFDRCSLCGNYMDGSLYLPFTRDNGVNELVNAGFTETEAIYALSTYADEMFVDGYDDRYALSYFTLERLLSNSESTPTREHCTNQLKNWGFTDDEINYANSKFDDYYFSSGEFY